MEKSHKRKESRRFRIINNLLENQEAQSRKMHPNQIEEVKIVLAVVQKKEEQTTPTPYRNPNYNPHFDQRHGQNEYSQKTYVDMRKYQHTKQQLRQIVPQKDLRASIKIDLGWTIEDMMRQFSCGMCNSYQLISSNVANTKREMTPRRYIKVNRTLISIHL